MFENSRHAARSQPTRPERPPVHPQRSLKVLAQSARRRNVEIITQCQPHIPEIVPLFDELSRCRPQRCQHMTAGDPGAEGITEFALDQTVELRTSHGPNANKPPAGASHTPSQLNAVQLRSRVFHMENATPSTAATTGRRSTAADIALMATFAALIIVLGAVTIPVGGLGVPIVLQNMGVALTAMILGWKRGGLAVTLFIAVGFLGVPNMAGWQPALAAVAGPTVGYVFGYIISAVVIGAIAQTAPRHHTGRVGVFILAGLTGVCVQYLSGTVGLMFRAGMDFTGALISNAPFIPGDIIKMILAALIAAAVLRALPDLSPVSRRHPERA